MEDSLLGRLLSALWLRDVRDGMIFCMRERGVGDLHAIPPDLIEIDLRYIAVVGPVMAPGYVLAPQTRD